MFLHADSEDSDQSLRWAHRSFCLFCNEAAHLHLVDYSIQTNWSFKGCLVECIFVVSAESPVLVCVYSTDIK